MRRFLLLSTAALAVAACSESLPLQTPDAPALNVTSAGTSRYAVLLRGAPADFNAKVASLGGTVELLHEGAGVAILSGISDAAAVALQGSANVELIIEDFRYQSVPRSARHFEMASAEQSMDVAGHGGVLPPPVAHARDWRRHRLEGRADRLA